LHGGDAEIIRSSAAFAPDMGWRLGHRPSLDGLRGVAILSVLLGHFGLPGWGAGGTVGVALFFSLSGYLITALLIGEMVQTGRIDLRGFYLRRARRLLPGLVVLLVVMSIWAVATSRTTWWTGAISVLFYAGNWTWLAGWDLEGIEHAWSLGVEEQFYILWPASLLLFGRRAIPATMIAISLSFLLTAVLIEDFFRSRYGTDVRVKDLLIGGLVAMLSMRLGRDLKLPTTAMVISVILLVIAGSNRLPNVNPLLTAVPSTVIVAWFASRPLFAAWPPLVFCGRISYGLYLLHFPFSAGPLSVFDGLSLWPRMGALFAVTFAAAAMSWYLVERRWTSRHRLHRA
jgi:peptidoglycan/LPS O-acetylase OafA/YrhL